MAHRARELHRRGLEPRAEYAPAFVDQAALAREYVSFALACDRVLPGLVDCYLGPAQARRVHTEGPPPNPTGLAARASWLRTEISRSDMAGQRRDFLDHQLVALQCALRRSAGAPVGYRAEVLAYFDTEITPGDTDRYRAAHVELDALLPGSGPLGERLAHFRAQSRIGAGALLPSAQRLAHGLRSQAARRGVELPAGESVELTLVADRAWSASHHYLGAFRSRVMVNADVELGPIQLARLVAHEAYPGHHIEYVRAEQAVRGAGGALRPENAVSLVNTPQCLLSEGRADLGLDVLLGSSYGDWTARTLADLGPVWDVELTIRVERAVLALLPVRQDAALLLHDRGAGEAAVLAYLGRWLLVGERRARQMLRFIAHPVWRAYTTTYVEGRRLVSAWLDATVAGESVTERYLRLLDEPRSPSSLRAVLSGHGGNHSGLSTANRGSDETNVNAE